VKLTKSQLKALIKEEMRIVVTEADAPANIEARREQVDKIEELVDNIAKEIESLSAGNESTRISLLTTLIAELTQLAR